MNYDGKDTIRLTTKNHGIVAVRIDERDYKHLLYAGKLRGLHVSKHGQFLYIKNHWKEYLHRLIMEPPKGKVVDHINRNPLDNRRMNLRVVTIQQNLRNQKRPNNTSGQNGVSFNKLSNRWEAYITTDYKRRNLGLFDKLEDAIKARKTAEKELWA